MSLDSRSIGFFAGGSVTKVTTIDYASQEWGHYHPSFLADGRHCLYYITGAREDGRGIYLGVLDQPMKQRLFGSKSNAVYAASTQGATGYLFYLQERALLAQPFDARELRPTGEPRAIAEKVGSDPNFSRGNFSVSNNGVLVYDPSLNRQSKQLVWKDRQGKQIRSLDAVGGYSKPWLSPDEKRVVVDRVDSQTDTRDLWLYDDSGSGGSPFTFDPGNDGYPVWSPDGSRIVWTSSREGTSHLFWKAASGAGQDEILLKSNYLKVPTDWSRDERFIIYYEINPTTRRDIWALPLFGDRMPFPFLQTESNEVGAQLSPDGGWMAYMSDESGTYEVYVRSFPSRGGQ